MRFFLAGIIQGSRQDRDIDSQDYRPRLRAAIERHIPGAEVYCPIANHPASVDYDDQQGRRVFLEHVERAASSDVLVTYLPEASLGTAVEMWETYRRGKVIVTISPMIHNWTIKFLSDAVYPSLEAFEQAAASGELARLIAGRKRPDRRPS